MLAISLGLYGMVAPHFLLVFFALFIYLGAAQESVAVLGRTLTHGIPTRAVMITEYHTLGHGSTLRDVAKFRLSTTQQDFPVILGDQVVGVVGRKSFPRMLAAEGPDAYVAGVMERDFLTLDPNADLAEILPLMAHSKGCALVVEEGRLLGLLTADHLSEFLQLRRSGLELGS
jgi:predicted transcriptional regulator